MSLQIISFDLDRIIVVLTVLELIQEPTMVSSSASRLQAEISTSPPGPWSSFKTRQAVRRCALLVQIVPATWNLLVKQWRSPS